jgi:organic hydroperoxide reductase OsmC/OhrA
MENQIQVKLVQQADFRFAADFGSAAIPVLITDEPAPLGGGQGPNPEQMLGTAVANCLSASLLFAMRKFKNDPSPLQAVATVNAVRNPQNRMRIGSIAVDLRLGVAASTITSLDRILAQFEDFCVVTQSVRSAIPVSVRVMDVDGTLLHTSSD